MIDERTIAKLEAAGCTHVAAVCAACGSIVQYPFRLMLTRKNITDQTTMAELRRRYRCEPCGSRAASSFGPWKQGGRDADCPPG